MNAWQWGVFIATPFIIGGIALYTMYLILGRDR